MADSPRLVSLRTAVPDYPVNQADAARRAGHLFQAFPEVLRLLPVFDNTGIETRYSCVPIGWYTEPHGWKERNELYLKHSVDLLERVTIDCLAEAELARDESGGGPGSGRTAGQSAGRAVRAGVDGRHI